MIVDSSALVAITYDEPESHQLKLAVRGGGFVPAPVLVEFLRVATRRGSRPAPEAEAVLQAMVPSRLPVVPFTSEDAGIAAAANLAHGAGNGRGGRLNLVDLMVYAIARRLGLPILCTGTDFATTEIDIHPASRQW